jgi:hypothetical protein
MNISNESYCSINEIKADVLLNVNDENERLLSPGFYVRQVKKALEELSFDTLFNVVYIDLDIPASLNLPIPGNMWNINDIFVYKQGSVDCSQPTCDDCSINGMERVFYKRHYISKGNGYGYTARNHEMGRDPFIRGAGNASNLKWYNVINGIIMLSHTCTPFDKIRIVANGLMSADVYQSKIVPLFVRDAVTLWATERAAFSLKSRDQKYRVIWMDTRTELFTPSSRATGNIWDEAKYRLKKRDAKEMADWRTYLGVMNY